VWLVAVKPDYGRALKMLQIDGGDKRNFGEFRGKRISASDE
jgi:hypothetical protein